MPPGAALVCGLLAAVYWPFVLYSRQLMATTLVLLLVTALLVLLLRPEDALKVLEEALEPGSANGWRNLGPHVCSWITWRAPSRL